MEQLASPPLDSSPRRSHNLTWTAGLALHNAQRVEASAPHLVAVRDDLDVDTKKVWATLRQVRGAIRDLREIRTMRQLLDATPAALCRVGFDRAMVSRVEDSTWVVERFYSETDAVWAAQINQIAHQTPQRLSPSLFETDMVRRRMPVLVTEAQTDARVNQALAGLTLSRSYVAAPIMPDGRVIGFLHADCFGEGRQVDRFDLEVLSYFAEQFGHVLERTLLLERLDSLRDSIGTLTEALNGTVDDCRRAAIDMSPEGFGAPAAIAHPLQAAAAGLRTPTASPDSVLTARELEVLKLMSTGDTNARIATRLVVSEGTVKTHVKNILRKLNAANRAEAVCRWLQRPA
jgi:DNA-binding CsgD family transcriptional regulator